MVLHAIGWIFFLTIIASPAPYSPSETGFFVRYFSLKAVCEVLSLEQRFSLPIFMLTLILPQEFMLQ